MLLELTFEVQLEKCDELAFIAVFNLANTLNNSLYNSCLEKVDRYLRSECQKEN